MSDLPDQISNCVSVPNGVKDAQANSFSNVESLIKSKSAALGLSYPGVFSMSASVSSSHRSNSSQWQGNDVKINFVQLLRSIINRISTVLIEINSSLREMANKSNSVTEVSAFASGYR